MLTSLHPSPRTVRVAALPIVLIVCFLPYLAEGISAHEQSPIPLPSELLADGEERAPSEPVTGSAPLQDCTLALPPSLSCATISRLIRTGEAPTGLGGSRAALYRLSFRPPPCRV